MENKHLRGLESELSSQITKNKKEGGVSNTLRKAMPRPTRRRDGFCFLGDIDKTLAPTKKWNWEKPKK